ncbi:E3 ubiquitin-protein ligase RNF19A-like [Salvelinus alpinus]|uniref:E3 ubiquitin-protein ligase RNF19A-like n=1 Tax=Salvelinus alpinus TaxID=8036 RepID=UPI0039FBEF27
MATQLQKPEKHYDPRDTTLKFVKRPDDITGDDYPEILKAEMSCGHAVTPESLTEWCRMLLNQKKFKFTCPATDKHGKECGTEWTYQEVRKKALLTSEEIHEFEETLAYLFSLQNSSEYKPCPGCRSNVSRSSPSNLCVHCIMCSAEKGQLYEFCWQCLRQWKGSRPRSDRCDNDGCTNSARELLKNCTTISFTKVAGVTSCPSVRACPTCGALTTHDQTKCKNITCVNCKKEFCFVCLKLSSECSNKDNGWFKPCSDGVAPRQTSIPSWSGK